MAAVITGTTGNDTLISTTPGDTILGLAGNDNITSTGNGGLAFGNSGDDTLLSLGANTLYGGKGNDYVKSGAGNSLLYGDLGADTLIATFKDTLYGGDALGTDTSNDSLIGQAQSLLFGNKGNDTLIGAATATLYGGQGDDILIGNGTGFLSGDQGDDSLTGQAGDTLLGGPGNDTLVSRGATLLYGNQGSDVLTIEGATTTNVTLYGGKDSDTIYGNGKSGVLKGDDGNDFLIATVPGAALSSADTVFGGNGADSILGSVGDDFLVGGNTTEQGTADTLDGVNTINGGVGNDRIFAGGAGSYILGGAGLDTIAGGAGNDIIYGGTEDDSISAGGGTDTVSGGTGNNTIQLEKDGVSDRILFVPSQATVAPDPLGLPLSPNEFFNGLPQASAPTTPKGDTITGFEVGVDKIILDGASGSYTLPGGALFTQPQAPQPQRNELFPSLNATLPVSLSVVTASNTTLIDVAQGFLVYYSPTGELFYNPNGITTGFGDANNPGGRFATLDKNLALSPTDFLIV